MELRGSRIGGLVVDIAARVMRAAGAGEVLVWRTVRDDLIGSGTRLASLGARTTKGVPGEVFSVRT